jgi:ATP/ADP translocase
MISSTALMIVGVLLFRLLLTTFLATSLWLLGALFVYVEILATLTIVQFWTLASEIFNAREAKRLFTPITAVGNVGGIIAGALVSGFVSVVGTANMLFVVALLLALYAGCTWMLGRIHAATLRIPTPRSDQAARAQPSLAENVRELTSTPLLLSIALVVVVMTMTTNVVSYQFDLTLRLQFANNDTGLSSFLGSFYFWAGLCGFVIQLVVTGPVMRRFGLVASLVVLPLSFALGSGLVLASTAALWAVTLTRSSDTVFRYTINDTAFGLLYVPVSRTTRARVKVIIDGILKPVSIGLTGIVFLIVGSLRGISPLPWSVVVVLLAVLWVALIPRMKQQ